MNKEERTKQFLAKVHNIMNTFYKEVQTPLVEVVNKYVSEEHETYNYNLWAKEDIKAIENLAFLTAWVEDHLNDKEAWTGSKDYSKSRTRKIRKALGYTI